MKLKWTESDSPSAVSTCRRTACWTWRWRDWRCGTCPSRRSPRRGKRKPETQTQTPLTRLQHSCYWQGAGHTHQSLRNDASWRWPGEDFNLTRSVDQDVPVRTHKTPGQPANQKAASQNQGFFFNRFLMHILTMKKMTWFIQINKVIDFS